MDWNDIETFFENRVWGTLTIGIITGLIVTLLLHLLGKLNKKYSQYRTMLKDSKKSAVDNSLKHKEFFQLIKAQHKNFGFLSLFAMLCAILVIVGENDFKYYKIISNILVALSITAFIYKIKYMRIIGNIHLANMNRKIDKLKAELKE